MTVSTDGTVIEGNIINGSLRITGDNVVIKNCIINFGGYWGVDAEGAKNITIQNCDIVGPGYSFTSNSAILGSRKLYRQRHIQGGERHHPAGWRKHRERATTSTICKVPAAIPTMTACKSMAARTAF